MENFKKSIPVKIYNIQGNLKWDIVISLSENEKDWEINEANLDHSLFSNPLVYSTPTAGEALDIFLHIEQGLLDNL